jgi:hypothetical protein
MEPYPPDYPSPAGMEDSLGRESTNSMVNLPLPSLSTVERILKYLQERRMILRIPQLWLEETAIYREMARTAVSLQERLKTLSELNPSSDVFKDPFGHYGRPSLDAIVGEGQRIELDAIDSLLVYRDKVKTVLQRFKWNAGIQQRFELLYAQGPHELFNALKSCEVNFNWMSTQKRYSDLLRKCAVLNERRTMPPESSL